ncbi:hypothetical protein [Kribbella catacumbae]|uniref:hypothetical protein n=1 Tax=Kribbella catacumbae TaxID=460086 RepID=UPI00037A07CA|nr:hypothetical protein [Kribbella catacumbae]
MPDSIMFIDELTMDTALGWVEAVDALEDALVSGAAPGTHRRAPSPMCRAGS